MKDYFPILSYYVDVSAMRSLEIPAYMDHSLIVLFCVLKRREFYQFKAEGWKKMLVGKHKESLSLKNRMKSFQQ